MMDMFSGEDTEELVFAFGHAVGKTVGNCILFLILISTWKVPYPPLLYCILSKIMFHYLKKRFV